MTLCELWIYLILGAIQPGKESHLLHSYYGFLMFLQKVCKFKLLDRLSVPAIHSP